MEKVGTAVGIQINTLWFKDESSPYKSCVKKLQSFMEKKQAHNTKPKALTLNCLPDSLSEYTNSPQQ